MPEMVCDYLCDAAGYFARRWQMEELIGAVCIRVRAEYAGNQELGLGETLPEHAHERDRAANSHIAWWRAKPFTRGPID